MAREKKPVTKLGAKHLIGYGAGDAAVLAVLAGNDLLCSTEYKTQYQAVLDAAQSGRIPQERINESVMRILRWKMDMGIWKIGAAQ